VSRVPVLLTVNEIGIVCPDVAGVIGATDWSPQISSRYVTGMARAEIFDPLTPSKTVVG